MSNGQFLYMVDVLTLFTLKVSSIRATKENFGEVTVFKLYVFEVLYINFNSMFLISINSKTSVSIPWIRNSRNTGQVQTKLKKRCRPDTLSYGLEQRSVRRRATELPPAFRF